MQLTLERNGYKIIFTSKKDISPSSLSKMFEIFSNIMDTLSEKDSGNTPVSVSTESIAESKATSQRANTAPQERPAFRDRLPNNVIDINDLTIEQAVTQNALVRCPECGQAHAIIVKSGNSLYLMRRDYDKNEFITISEINADDKQALINVCCDEDTDKAAYFSDLQGISEFAGKEDFTVSNTTEIFCPVCNSSNPFSEWKHAFDTPLNYFETEELCDACGGEIVDKLTKGKHTCHCEKCGLEREIHH